MLHRPEPFWNSYAQVSWYSPHLVSSLERIAAHGATDACIIDVGAGASTLVDDLLDRGYSNLTVLDISESALAVAKERLGDRAAAVDWIVSNVLSAELPERTFDVWHDRAVFHFLTQQRERQAYLELLSRSLTSRGTVIISTFSLAGPSKCSGLDVVRYSADSLAEQFGSGFDLIFSREETHMTPAGAEQRFVLCEFKKRS